MNFVKQWLPQTEDITVQARLAKWVGAKGFRSPPPGAVAGDKVLVAQTAFGAFATQDLKMATLGLDGITWSFAAIANGDVIALGACEPAGSLGGKDGAVVTWVGGIPTFVLPNAQDSEEWVQTLDNTLWRYDSFTITWYALSGAGGATTLLNTAFLDKKHTATATPSDQDFANATENELTTLIARRVPSALSRVRCVNDPIVLGAVLHGTRALVGPVPSGFFGAATPFQLATYDAGFGFWLPSSSTEIFVVQAGDALGAGEKFVINPANYPNHVVIPAQDGDSYFDKDKRAAFELLSGAWYPLDDAPKVSYFNVDALPDWIVAMPPAGKQVLVSSGAGGAFNAQSGKLATSNGSAWVFTSLPVGTMLTVGATEKIPSANNFSDQNGNVWVQNGALTWSLYRAAYNGMLVNNTADNTLWSFNATTKLWSSTATPATSPTPYAVGQVNLNVYDTGILPGPFIDNEIYLVGTGSAVGPWVGQGNMFAVTVDGGATFTFTPPQTGIVYHVRNIGSTIAPNVANVVNGQLITWNGAAWVLPTTIANGSLVVRSYDNSIFSYDNPTKSCIATVVPDVQALRAGTGMPVGSTTFDSYMFPGDQSRLPQGLSMRLMLMNIDQQLRRGMAIEFISFIKITGAPPGAPVAGDKVLVPSFSSGAFAGQEHTVATYNGAIWTHVPVDDGAKYIALAGSVYAPGTVWEYDPAGVLLTVGFGSRTNTPPIGSIAYERSTRVFYIYRGNFDGETNNSFATWLPIAVTASSVTLPNPTTAYNDFSGLTIAAAVIELDIKSGEMYRFSTTPTVAMIVDDRLNNPPGAPATGMRVIVDGAEGAGGATGAFLGQEGSIATWNGAAWTFANAPALPKWLAGTIIASRKNFGALNGFIQFQETSGVNKYGFICPDGQAYRIFDIETEKEYYNKAGDWVPMGGGSGNDSFVALSAVAAQNGVKGKYLLLNCTAAITITPPTGMLEGEWFGVIDARGLSDVNNVSVLTTTDKIKGVAENTTIAWAYAKVRFVYIDSTTGYISERMND